ncbi:MurR/RpiR family transcriptional regulator [Amycolatopsis ultiminotia]|uniref:MurR/RpiR family transcriptional regulator n=1 Tax=Amycolatopsis ultiminotia TaxID=543629 RepID=A0ABP6W3A1_9PSEU
MAEPEELRTQLATLAPTLGKAQRQAARAMLEDLDAVAYLPAAELAERADVHTATVVRLAQRLGFEGYPHLQRSLRSTLSKYPHFLQELSSGPETGDGAAMVEGVLAQARRNLDQLARTASPANLAAAAETLAGARRVLVLGFGVAGPVATHLASSLRLLGVAADQPADLVSTVQQLGLLGPEDVLVAVDFHRYYRATVDAAAAAAAAGVRVLALTDSAVSPLASSAQLTLIAPSESPAPRTSLAPALTVVEALIALTARADPARAEDAMRRIDTSYTDLRIFVGE